MKKTKNIIIKNNNNKLLISVLCVVLLLNANYIFSQQAPKYSNEFLSIGTGARALAMGNSNVASVSDVSAAYWNTAALTQLSYPISLGLMHAEYFAGLAQYNFGTFAFKPNKNTACAISLIRFGVDNIPNTTQLIDENGQLRFDRISNFSVADYSVLLSYAQKMDIEGLSIGGNVKIIRRVAGKFANAWGFGVDLSALYIKNDWKFGLMIRDVTTTFNSWSFDMSELKDVFEITGNKIPKNSTEITLPKIIMGVAYEKEIYKKIGALAEINLDISTDGKRNVLISGKPFSIDPHMGVEVNYNKMFFVRAGMNNIQKEPKGYNKEMEYKLQPNMGVGIKYKQFEIAYAITNLGNVSTAGYSHIISLSYSVDKIKLKNKN